MKVCTRCKCEKEDTEFRVREDKRIKHKRKCIYLNNTCKECDIVIANERHAKQKSDPEYKKKHAKWAIERYWKNRDKMIAKGKIERQKESAKINRKKYIIKNKDKIYQQEVIAKRRYHEKNRDEISDVYCINHLRQQNKEITPDNIEIKRVEILKKRIKLEILKKQRNG